MPRLSAEQLDRLKQAVSLERLVEARGIVLKKHGADLIGHCPFHDDKTHIWTPTIGQENGVTK